MTPIDNLIKRLRSRYSDAAQFDQIAIGLQQVADRIKEVVGAQFRPAWADPTIAARDLSTQVMNDVSAAADALERLKAALEKIAACEKVCDGDVVDVARRALNGEG